MKHHQELVSSLSENDSRSRCTPSCRAVSSFAERSPARNSPDGNRRCRIARSRNCRKGQPNLEIMARSCPISSHHSHKCVKGSHDERSSSEGAPADDGIRRNNFCGGLCPPPCSLLWPRHPSRGAKRPAIPACDRPVSVIGDIG